MLSITDVFVSLDTSAELTPPKRGHYGPVSQARQRPVRGDQAGQDRHGYELWRATFTHLTLTWHQYTGMYRIEQLGQIRACENSSG